MRQRQIDLPDCHARSAHSRCADPAVSAIAAGEPARGERTFQRCYACHPVDLNETARLQGPSLYRIIGRPASAVPGFSYSNVMKEKGAAGLVWDADTLERYVADPLSAVVGTSMNTAGFEVRPTGRQGPELGRSRLQRLDARVVRGGDPSRVLGLTIKATSMKAQSHKGARERGRPSRPLHGWAALPLHGAA
jgi:cytochrome c2